MKNSLIYIITILLVFVTIQVTHAQASIADLNDAIGFDSTIDDVPEAPIHFLVGLGMLVGTCIGFRKTKLNPKN
jgi:hypothetical protein